MRLSLYTLGFTLLFSMVCYVSMAQKPCKVPDSYIGKWYDKEDGFTLEVTCDSAILSIANYRYAYKLKQKNSTITFTTAPKELITFKMLDEDIVSLIFSYTDGSKVIAWPNYATKYRRLE